MNILKKDNTFSIDKKIIDNIRGLSLDAIDNAKSGHPGIALGSAPILATLYGNHLKFDVEHDKWINRDRFVLSAGHGSALLYSVLYASGFNISLDDLKKFRKLNSITPGHPEYGVTPGVDMTTGPLGQGIASSVGMAIAEKYLSNYFGKNIIDYNVYVLCGDGDLMEGVSYEACSLAGHLQLDNLIVLYDSNNVTLDGQLANSNSENTKLRFEAMNWDYILVSDGDEASTINEAIVKAKNSNRPVIIEIKTIIGKYSNLQGTNEVHGKPLSSDDLKNVKEKLGLRDIPFTVSDEAINNFRTIINERNANAYDKWLKEVEKLDDDKKEKLNSIINFKNEVKVKDIYYDLPEEGIETVRVTSGKILNSIAQNYPFIIGGSADTAASTFAYLNNDTSFSNNNPSGRNINFGVREHAMGAIANGLALSGLTPFVSTFLSFSDYLKPSIRMSSLMNLPVMYVFTHDSISIGEDGPTHAPVEQLVMLRSIPNFDVYRPHDANEVLGSYKSMLESRRPSAIVLSRNKVKINENTKVNDVKKGAYIFGEERGSLEAIIISCGEELSIANEVYNKLTERGISIRLVSMPSMSLFERQSSKYKESVLPTGVRTFVIELSSSYSWYKYAKNDENLFTVDSFGASGSSKDVLKKYGFDSDVIADKIEKLLR